MGNRAYSSELNQAYPNSIAGAEGSELKSVTQSVVNNGTVNVQSLGVISVSFKEDVLEANGANNTSSTDSVPTMTNYTVPSGTVFSMGDFGGQPAWKAFDNIQGTTNNSSDWASNGVASPSNPEWAGYQFTAQKIINKVTIMPRHTAVTTQSPENFTIEGSNDGTNYVILKTITGESSWTTQVNKVYTFTNSTGYYYYRIKCTKTNNGAGSSNFGVDGIEFIEAVTSEGSNWLIQSSNTTTYAKLTPEGIGSKTVVITNKSGITRNLKIEYFE